jgi:hypothetical protein
LVLELISAQLPNFVPEHFDLLSLIYLTPEGPLLDAILKLGPGDNAEVIKAMFTYLRVVLKNDTDFFWNTVPPWFILNFFDGGTTLVQELVITFMSTVRETQTGPELLTNFVGAFLEWFPRVEPAVRSKMMEFFMSAVSVYPVRQGTPRRPFMTLEKFWEALHSLYERPCQATEELFAMLGSLPGRRLSDREVRHITALLAEHITFNLAGE